MNALTAQSECQHEGTAAAEVRLLEALTRRWLEEIRARDFRYVVGLARR